MKNGWPGTGAPGRLVYRTLSFRLASGSCKARWRATLAIPGGLIPVLLLTLSTPSAIADSLTVTAPELRSPDTVVPSAGRAGPVSGLETVPTLKFFQRSDGGLRAVDPLNPTAPPIVVDALASPPPGGIIATAIYVAQAEFDAVHAMSRNTRLERAFYTRSDGTLWQVAAARSGNAGRALAPAPFRVSSESEAFRLCTASAGSQFEPIEQVRVLYTLPGPDGDCSGISPDNDNIHRVVRLGDGIAQAPLAFPGEPLNSMRHFIHPVTGVHAGWLSRDGNRLLYVRPDVSGVPVALVDNFVIGYGQVRTGHVFLNLDGNLMIFLPGGTGILRDTGYDFPVSPLTGLATNLTGIVDGERLYFVASTATASVALYVAEVNGVVRVLYQPPDAIREQTFSVALPVGDRIVLAYDSTAGTTKFVSVSRAGTGALTLHETAGTAFLVGIVDGRNAYINQDVGISRPQDFLIVSIDGAGPVVRHADSVFREVGFPVDYPAFRFIPADSVFLLSGIQSGGLSVAGGASLRVFEVETPAVAPTLGRVPEEFNDFFPGHGFDRYHLAQAVEIVRQGTTVIPRSDLFFLDRLTPNSLRRITNTPQLSEFPLKQ